MLFFLLIKYFSSNNIKNKYKLSRRFIIFYFLFVLFSALALVLNGEYQDYDFTKLILANYLNCFVTYFAFDYFIKDSDKLNKTLLFFIIIIALDAIVTILQFIGNPIGKAIAIALTTVAEVRSDIADDHNINTSLLLGEAIPMGFFGYVFTNCNYLALFGIQTMGFIKESNKIKRSLLILILLLCFYACFATQERMALFMFAMMTFFLFFTGSATKQSKVMVGSILALAIVVVLPSLLLSDKLGRLTSADYKEDVRGEIWSYAFDFLKENLILGGPVAYSKKTDIAPHNFFLNVFIDSGLIGGLIAIYLYLYMTLQSVKIVLRKFSDVTRTLAASICIYGAVCLFHNASIATGDTSIFILYAAMLKSYMFDKANIRVSNISLSKAQ